MQSFSKGALRAQSKFQSIFAKGALRAQSNQPLLKARYARDAIIFF